VTGRGVAGSVLLAAFAAFAAALVVTTRARPAETASRPPAPRAASGAARTSSEEEAVLAAAGRSLRPATDEDAAESEGRDELYALYGDYSPYFVRGDFDGDGRLDFAQAFVRRDGPEALFDVAVFFGATGNAFGPPVWVDRGLALSGGDLSADRSVLVVTDDIEEDVSRRWRWEPSSGRFVDVDAGRGGPPEGGWAEPDGPLGTTA